MASCPRCGNVFASAGDGPCPIDGSPLGEGAPDLAGRLAGRFRIGAPLAAGRTSRVFHAEDARAGRTVALKVLHGEIAADRKLAARCFERARAVARGARGQVVGVEAAGFSDTGLAFIARALVEGPSLAASLRETGARPARGAAHVVRELALILARLHARGVAHQDLRPGAVLLRGERDAEEVLLLDGAAGPALDPAARLPFVRDPAHLAPEIVAGGAWTAASDLYLLGVILYELLIGVPPFDRAAAHAEDAVPVPALEYGGLTVLLVRLLDKEPARRPAAAVVVETIDRLGFSILPRRASGARKGQTTSGRGDRSRGRGPAAAAVVLAMGLGAGTLLWRAQRVESGAAIQAPAPSGVAAEPPAEGQASPDRPAARLDVAGGQGPARRPEIAAAPDRPAARLDVAGGQGPTRRPYIAEARDAGAAAGAEAAPDAAYAAFTERDFELGRALSDRELAWDDLARVEPALAKRWSRWYRHVAPPSADELASTYAALMAAVAVAERAHAAPAKESAPPPAPAEKAPAREDDGPAPDAGTAPPEPAPGARARPAPEGAAHEADAAPP